MEKEQTHSKKMTRVGIVASNKMDKTITVVVDRKVLHPVVKKYIRRKSKFMVHDEKSEAQPGDKVRIIEARPMSKCKKWKLDSVLEKKINIER